jgi:HEAT repeat protein
VLAASALLGAGRDQELEQWLRDLDRSREPGWTAAIERLAELGQPAAARALQDFRAVGFAARRSRAWLLLEIPEPGLIPGVLLLLDDPDPQVRRLLTRWLGLLALGEAAAAERVQALSERARGDPDARVREAARKALSDSALAAAVPALDRLLDESPADEAADAARRLSELSSARTRLVARVTAAFGAGAAPLPDQVLAALLRGYGRALAEVPLGGGKRAERLPFLHGKQHPSGEVRAAARAALGTCIARLAELKELRRAEDLLAALQDEGWEPETCLRQRLTLALLERGDVELALSLARELERRARALAGDDAEAWELHGCFYQGACLFARREFPAAGALFERMRRRLEAACAERGDRFPAPGREGAGLQGVSRAGGALLVDRLHQLALVHEWQALVHIAGGADPGAEAVLRELARSHELLLRLRGVALRTDAPDPASLDSFFERDLGPQVLLLFNARIWSEQRDEALDLARGLATAWATVAPGELPGFASRPAPERALSDPFHDPRRLGALQALRQAELEEVEREELLLGEAREQGWSPQLELQLRILDHRRSEIRMSILEEREALERSGGAARLDPAGLRAVYQRLALYLTPSQHALSFASELRSEGRAAEARVLAESALSDLRTGNSGGSTWNEWTSAQLELLRSSTFMDEERPAEAERAALDAVRRLEAIENTLEERRGTLRDPEEGRQMEAQLRMVRERRGNALLSLAVNANVRMGDAARALEYFEQAYLLDQSAFMRVLRACYRARSGRSAEARAVLQSVVPAPALYYNIACTYALLGEKELALDFLERDLNENYPTSGARERQRDWARKDPDLSSLRGEPRFERLVGPPPAAQGEER